MQLLPHQRDFIKEIFAPGCPHTVILQSDVGLGKGAALAGLAAEFFGRKPDSRLLFLVPASIRLQMVEMLRERGVPSILVDRFKFRELLDAAEVGATAWASGTAFVLSLEFAVLPDITDSLSGADWDLVVVEEAQRLSSGRVKKMFARIRDRARRIILTHLKGLEIPDEFAVDSDISVVQWGRRDVVGEDGQPLFDTIPRPELVEVAYELTPAEMELASLVDAAFEQTGEDREDEPLGRIKKRRLRSSPAALEAAIEGLLRQDSGGGEFSDDDDDPESAFGTPISDEVRGSLEGILQKLEDLTDDSKASAVMALVGKEMESDTEARICILTSYLPTFFSLVSEASNEGSDYEALNGSMNLEARAETLESFARAGRLLIATPAILGEGVNMSHVSSLILYDLPDGDLAMRQVLGRFDRFGRTRQLKIYIPVNKGDPPTASNLIDRIRGLLEEE